MTHSETSQAITTFIERLEDKINEKDASVVKITMWRKDIESCLKALRVAVEGLENISGTNGGDVTTLSPSSEEIAQHLLCVISTLLS